MSDFAPSATQRTTTLVALWVFGTLDRAEPQAGGNPHAQLASAVPLPRPLADNRQVRAVVARCPYLELSDQLEPRGLNMMRYVPASVLDLVPFLPPVYIPVFGKAGEWVFAPSHENPSVNGFDEELGCAFWQSSPSRYAELGTIACLRAC